MLVPMPILGWPPEEPTEKSGKMFPAGVDDPVVVAIDQALTTSERTVEVALP